MKNKLAPFFAAAGLIFLIAVVLVGVQIFRKYVPSDEWSDKQQLLKVEGEETAVFLNSQLQEEKGITREGQSYLPLAWVNEHLNEKFYWDDTEKLLVYTLPEAIVYADKRTMGSTDAPLLLVEDSGVYISISLVATYTDVQSKTYDSDGVNRVFLDNEWKHAIVTAMGKSENVREKDGIKSPIITQLNKNDEVRIWEQIEDWSKVETGDGYIGYVRNKAMSGTQAEVPQVSDFQEPVYTNIALDEKVCLVWHQVTTKEANSAMETMIANTMGVNVIAPTWFALTDNKGNYESYAERSYVDKAHAKGMQVWGVLDNFNKGENVDSGVLFAQTSVRKTLIANLMNDVREYGLDGINLDIEGISPSAGPHYVQFIRELSVECRKNGIILSVDNYVPSAYTSFYNRAEQGRVADYVIMMGYDEHYAGGEMGSVASLPYVTKGINDMLREVPKEKLINAVPFYTRVWTDQGGKITSSALGIPAAKAWVAEKQVELYWQEAIGQYYGELQTDEGAKFVWMEEEKSLEKKMDAIRAADLAGVACWKLGLESAEIWNIVKVNE